MRRYASFTFQKAFKALRLRNSENTAELISIGHGVSITDNWWIQRDDENLEYRELKKYNEQIADIALLGGSDSDERNTEGYLELGTVGSYEKAWLLKETPGICISRVELKNW